MSAWADNLAYYSAHDTGLKFVEVILVKSAALEHMCSACGRTIEKGRPYKREVGMKIGIDSPWVTKEHMDCYAESPE